MVKKNLGNKERRKISAVLLAVILIWSFLPANRAFAATPSAPASPDITPSGGIYASPQEITVSIDTKLWTGQAVYYTIASSSTGATPSATSAAYSAPFNLPLPAGITTMEAAVYDSSTGLWSDMASATFTVSYPSPGGGDGCGVVVYTPAIQTEAATAITATSAALNGDITSDNVYVITDSGFLWDTNSSSLTNKLDLGSDNQSGAFTTTLSSLTTGMTYYFQAYATNSYGTADGTVNSFIATAVASPPAPAQIFSDVSATYWGYDAISNLSSKGIISGYPDGTFKPDACISRTGFATMLAKALELRTSGTTGAFPDFTADSGSYVSVNAAVPAALVSGMGDSPFALITREQMAVMVTNALGDETPATDGAELNTFNDGSQVSGWVISSMDEVVKAGIVIGMSANRLDPMAHATRAQAAAMIYKMLAFLGQ